MKKFNLVLAAVVFTISTAFVVNTPGNPGGKEDVAEFHVNYDMSFESDDPSMEQVMPMLQGSKMEVFKSKKFNKVIVKTGSISEQTTIIDNKTGNGIMLMSGMMGKSYMKIDGKEDKKAEKEPEVKKTTETKKILGYNCTKFIVTQEGQEMEMWATTEIKGKLQSRFTENIGSKVEGFPLMIMVEQNNMVVTMTATKFEDKVPSGTDFSTKVPDGYTEVTPEQLKAMGGQK